METTATRTTDKPNRVVTNSCPAVEVEGEDLDGLWTAEGRVSWTEVVGFEVWNEATGSYDFLQVGEEWS